MTLNSQVLALAALALWGCSGDATTTIDPGPTGQPSVRFSDPPSGGEPACVAVGTDANTRVPLLVDVTELELRPPGGCGAVVQCGRLALYADGVLNNETAVPAVDLLVYRLGDPYHDGAVHAATGAADVLTVRVDVLDDASDEVVLDHDGEPLSDTLELITVPSCDDVN